MWENLIHAVETNDVAQAKKIIGRIDLRKLETPTEDGELLVMKAARHGYKEICMLLFNTSDSSINAVDNDGVTALMCAAANNHRQTCELLIKLSPSFAGAVDKNGWSALTYAAFWGHKETCEFLISNIDLQDLNKVSNEGKTSLTYADEKGFTKIVDLIKSKQLELTYKKALNLSQVRQDLEALKTFDEVLKMQPKYFEAHFNKGKLLHILNRYLEAIECFDLAINLKADRADFYYHLAMALKNTGQYVKALESLNLAIKLDAGNEEIQLEKVNCLSLLEKNLEIIETIETIETIGAQDTRSYYNKAMELNTAGENIEAIDTCEQALKVETNEVLYYCIKAKALNYLEKEQEALDCFNEASRIYNQASLKQSLDHAEIDYLNKTLLEDRQELLEQLSDLQKSTIETKEAINKLDRNDYAAKKAVEKFNTLKDQKSELTGKVINSFSIEVSALDNSNYNNQGKNKTAISLTKQIESLQYQMQALFAQVIKGQINLKQNQDKIFANQQVISNNQERLENNQHEATRTILENQEQNFGIVLIKQEEHKQTLIGTVNKIDYYNKELTGLKIIIREMTDKIESDDKVNKQTKDLMSKTIAGIEDKIQKLASKESIEFITHEIVKLMNDNKITEVKLIDLEEEVDDIISRQEQFIQRNDSNDSNDSNSNITLAYMSKIIYDKPILNHLNLLESSIKIFGISKALDLAETLDKNLITQGIISNDEELILAGMVSMSL